MAVLFRAWPFVNQRFPSGGQVRATRAAIACHWGEALPSLFVSANRADVPAVAREAAGPFEGAETLDFAGKSCV